MEKKKEKSPPSRNEYYKVKADGSTKPLILQRAVWQKMSGWCKAANGEVSGLGLIEDKKTHYEVYDVFLPPQYGSTGFTELDQNGIAELMMRLYKKGVPLEHLRYWWHTHYNFGTFWSGTDEEMARVMAVKSGNWAVSTVINQSDHALTRYDLVDPTGLCIDQVDTKLGGGRNCEKKSFADDVRRVVRPLSERPGGCATLREEFEPAKKSEQHHGQYARTGYLPWEDDFDQEAWLAAWRKNNAANVRTKEEKEPETKQEEKPKRSGIPFKCILTGYEIMKILSIPPGPMVGLAVKALNQAVKEGLIVTVGDAMDWLPIWYKSYGKQAIGYERRDPFANATAEERDRPTMWVTIGGRTMTLKEYTEMLKESH